MNWRNTKDSWGLTTITFHWVMAALVIFMLVLGLYMTRLTPSPTMFKLFGLHKSIGILILFLSVFRLSWLKISPPPAPLPTHKSWEVMAAKASKFFFYFAMIGLPLSGWVMSSAKGYGVSVFNLFTLPHITSESKILAAQAATFHHYVAYLLIAVTCIHVAAALKHKFIDHDQTIERMLPAAKAQIAEVRFRSFLCALAVLMGILSYGASAQSSGPAHWIIDKDASNISFSASQMGAPFDGKFSAFTGEIYFDAKSPENGHALIEIDAKSIVTGGAERDMHVTNADWFAVDQFPKAIYKINSFEKKDGGYIAKGDLTIRDVTRPLELPFILSIEGDQAKASGTISINRLDYGVGQGEWKDTSSVGDEVQVRIDISARRA